MLSQFLEYRNDAQDLQCDKDISHSLQDTFSQLINEQYDARAIASVIRSLQEDLDGLEEDFKKFITQMSDLDDTWKFWARFVFEYCFPCIMLYLSIRSGKWNLRMGAIKSMAANFAVFDHPIYQRLISTHILDIAHMPPQLLEFLKLEALL